MTEFVKERIITREKEKNRFASMPTFWFGEFFGYDYSISNNSKWIRSQEDMFELRIQEKERRKEIC